MKKAIAMRLGGWSAISAAVLLAACSSAPPPAPQAPPAPAPVAAPPVLETPKPPPAVAEDPITNPRVSQATTPRAYRRDAATHLYGLHGGRIYKGRMPPLLYAVGVLQVEVDRNGSVKEVSWMRAPKHAPEVMAEIEKMVRAAAPYPAPAKMGRVTYTDTWLWHKSGRFQLDTLTEGQD
jgi:periplasmic protein TonB